ncbi:MAG: hypothetical protein Q7K03_09450 [Dehalococcoidia bacterium]|nr:hypothetical protein [Dehalococcoidia bacterium]
MIEPMIPLAGFGREIGQYDPVEVVLKCAATSRYMDKNNETLHHEPFTATVAGVPQTRNALVTHHGLAAVVRLAIRNHPWARGKPVSAKDIMAQANNWNNVEDPFLGSGIMTLVRVAYEQFPYQEQLDDLIPRYLTILTETRPANPPLDIQGAFKIKTGLTIEEFMKIGIAFYAGGLHYASFTRCFLEGTKAEKLKPCLTPEKIDAFLKAAAADFPTFRRHCLQEEREAPGAGKWVFNSLVSRPVVIFPDGRFCVPILRLLIHRITKGIYYDLLDAYYAPKHNPFTDWFGHAFEEYGGIILRKALDQSMVYSEPAYGSSERRGPDWTVLGKKVGLAMEFRSSRLPKVVRSTTERDEVMNRVHQGLAQTAARLPAKIQAILDGSAGLPASGVSEIVPAIVTLESWHPEALTADLIRRELQKYGIDAGRFQLMSIGDLEWLLTWAQHEPPAVVLRDKLSDPALDDLSVSQYLRKRADDKGLSFPLRILKDKSDAFFGEITGPDDNSSDTSLQTLPTNSKVDPTY